MIYITNLIEINTSKFLPNAIYYNPLDPVYGSNKTIEEMQADGYLLNMTYNDLKNGETQFKLNNPEPTDGVYTVELYFNPQTMQFFYEYVRIGDLPEPDELTILKEKQALMQQALDELLLGGM